LGEFEARAVASANAKPNAPPCFSPDGDWIAYSEGDALNKAQVSPGAATPVARDLDGADVCFWGDDGYIYFSATPGIMRVREAGGSAEVVAAPSEERGEIRFESPQLLPGGAQLLYSVYGEQGDTTARVDVLTLTTRKRKTVLDGVGVATFVPVARNAPRGYLVYGLNAALFAAPFDSRSLETGGARAVASDMSGVGAWSSAGVSASGTLAYLSPVKLEGNATLVVMDRDGTQHRLPEPPRLYGEVQFSPDGRRVEVGTNSPTLTSTDTWIYELDGGGLTRLPIGGANFGNVWTPDGRRLIYFHQELTTLPGIAVRGAGEIQSVPADGSGPASTLVAQASWMSGLAFPMSVSPDGKTLLVSQNGAAGDADVLALALDEGSPPGASTTAPRPFIATRFNERLPKFSPDGHLVAYVSDESGENEIYVVPFPGPGGKSQVSRGGGTSPRWNRNGRELFYLSNDGKLMSVAVETTPAFRADAPRVLFDDPQIMQRPGFPYDASPDGTRFIVIRADAGGEGVRAQSELRVVVNWIDELERAPKR
jgi:Tol biopolymer transport system component